MQDLARGYSEIVGNPGWWVRLFDGPRSLLIARRIPFQNWDEEPRLS